MLNTREMSDEIKKFDFFKIIHQFESRTVDGVIINVKKNPFISNKYRLIIIVEEKEIAKNPMNNHFIKTMDALQTHIHTHTHT